MGIDPGSRGESALRSVLDVSYPPAGGRSTIGGFTGGVDERGIPESIDGPSEGTSGFETHLPHGIR